AEAHQELVQAQQELAALEGDLAEQTDHLRGNHLVGTINLTYLQAHRRFVAGMHGKARLIAQKIAAAQQRVDAARAQLLESTRDRKVLEKLKERQQSRWQEDDDRRSNAELDEVGDRLGAEYLAEGGGES